METERSTDVGTPSAELTTPDDSIEVLTPEEGDVTDEIDALASTIVISDFERQAEQARASADADAIQEVQDEYNDARRKRAERIIRRKRESETT